MFSILVLGYILSALALSHAEDSWSMKPVRTIQARADGGVPIWNETRGRWVSKYGEALDTVDLASVEGALKYPQSECINAAVQTDKCQRKNGVAYIWFFDITIVQPTASLAYYSQSDSVSKNEYADYVAMDDGKCTPVGDKLPEACTRYIGDDTHAKYGFAVGAADKDTDARAPYPGTVWTSFPNSCPTKTWGKKNEQCLKEQQGGLCPDGVEPDGVQCTFKYEILGYISLDELVGITSMVNNETGKNFTDFKEFCEAGLVEFNAPDENDFSKYTSDLTFWNNPTNETANVNRTNYMVDHYNEILNTQENMTALPDVKTLTAGNPKCYENVAKCGNGCKRNGWGQFCEQCTEGEDCVKAPSDFSFPALTYPADPTPEPTSAPSNNDDNSDSSSAASLALYSFAFVLLNAYVMF
jgi:hypothetical protein